MDRKEALRNNLKRYFGLPCKHCGGVERFTSNYSCVKCSNNNDYLRKYSKTNKAKQRSLTYMQKYKESGKVSEVNKRYASKNKDKFKKYYKENKNLWKNSQLKRDYNITIEEYNVLLYNQNFKCSICEIHIDNLTKKLHVDHDHTTGRIRGLLCHHCNTGLGLFKDSEDLLNKAVRYLKCE